MSIAQATAEALAAARRGVILRLILDTGNFGLSSDSLQDAFDLLGRPAALDQIRKDMLWLEQAMLVTTESLEATVIVAKLTSKGEDVAKGRISYPGVQRPDR